MKKTQPFIDAIQQWAPSRAKEQVPAAQVAIYVMAGGGLIGRLYAEQPQDAYTDARAGRRPYGGKDLERARLILCALAARAGLDSREMPPMPRFHNLGVF
jgi:hypothetical protein